jgi:quercetin 2,3-dioxygenase
MQTESTQAKERSLATVLTAVRRREGAGFIVRRPFPSERLDMIDPFLLLDEMGPANHRPGEAKGAPDHPHRGFETVTYLLDGEFQHHDSAGNSGTLRSGDVQWMTAGSGVIHSEMPSDELQKKGGRLHGFQLWVNLPRRDKMIAPRYQDTASSKIPIVTTRAGSRVKVIAGEALGTSAVIDTRTPILYLHVTLVPGDELVQSIPADYNAFVYVFGGKARVTRGSELVREGQIAVLARDGDALVLANPADAEEPLQALVIGGRPLDEPVVHYGPFVMNTEQEIMDAIADFRSGRFGEIPKR